MFRAGEQDKLLQMGAAKMLEKQRHKHLGRSELSPGSKIRQATTALTTKAKMTKMYFRYLHKVFHSRICQQLSECLLKIVAKYALSMAERCLCRRVMAPVFYPCSMSSQKLVP